jgi:hypothetical protein
VGKESSTYAVLLRFAHADVDQSRLSEGIRNSQINEVDKIDADRALKEFDRPIVKVVIFRKRNCNCRFHAIPLREGQTMSDDSVIKSGPEIVSEFLDSLGEGDSIDPQTVASIRELHKSGNLTRTRLLQSLEQARSGEGKGVSSSVNGE